MYIQVITTISDKQGAERIAAKLLDKRLAACVQIIGPMKSVYRWRGKIVRSKEWICLIKTKKALYKKVEAAIKKIHPYEVPEIIASPILNGDIGYLKWISTETI